MAAAESSLVNQVFRARCEFSCGDIVSAGDVHHGNRHLFRQSMALPSWALQQHSWATVASWSRSEVKGDWHIYSPRLHEKWALSDEDTPPGIILSDAGLAFSGPYRMGLSQANLSGGVRVTVDLRMNDQDDALEMSVNADDVPLNNRWRIPAGHTAKVQASANKNGVNRMGFSEIPILPMQLVDHGNKQFLQTNRLHRIIYEVSATQSQVLVDGERILHMWQIRPRSAGQALFVRTFQESTTIENIIVERLVPPTHASPVQVADAFYREGLYLKAFNEYAALAESHHGTAIGEQALARACQIALTQQSIGEEKAQELLAQFYDSYPNSVMTEAISWVEARQAAETENWIAAVNAAQRILSLNNGARIAQRLQADIQLRDTTTATIAKQLLTGSLLQIVAKV